MPNFWNFISSYGIIALFVLGALVIWRTHGVWSTLRYAIVIILTWFLNGALKYLINRPRPFEVGDAQASAALLVHTPSFPSGHAAAAFAIATFVFLCVKDSMSITRPDPILATLIILAVLIAVSRVQVGVHYVSDVVAGAILGIIVSLVAWRMIKKL